MFESIRWLGPQMKLLSHSYPEASQLRTPLNPSRFSTGVVPYLLLYVIRTGFVRDKHIPNLLRFSPQVTFHEDPFYMAGKIILQDKASCFSAVVLAPPATDSTFVIDATSAPGNKTSHISALMQNKGKASKVGTEVTSLRC